MRMHNLLIYLAFGLSLIGLNWIASCASTQTTVSTTADALPRWVTTGEESPYTQQTYLLALGEGGSYEAAEQNARAEIARIFKTNVKASTYVGTTATQKESDSSFEYSSKDDFNEQIHVTTDKVLYGVSILKRHTNTERYWALVGIQRARAIQMYGDLIRNIDKEIARIRESFDQNENNSRYDLATFNLFQMKNQSDAKSNLQQELSGIGMVMPSANLDTGDWIESTIRHYREKYPISLEAPEDEAYQGVVKNLKKTLSEIGYTFQQSKSPVALRLQANVSMTESPSRIQGFTKTDIDLDLAWVSLFENSQLLSGNWRASGMGTTKNQALNFATRNLFEDNKNEIRQFLLGGK